MAEEDPNTVSATELARLRVEVWKKTIETQMHFNEMSVKARQLGMTFVVGALGLAVVLLGRSEPLIIGILLGQLNIRPMWLVS